VRGFAIAPFFVSGVLVLLIACGSPAPTSTLFLTATLTPIPTPTATPPPTATPTHEPTATPQPTVTPTPEPTATPTSTPVPTATPTPAPTPTPSPTPVVSSAPVAGKRGGKLTTVGLANIPHLDVHQEVQETLSSLGPGIVYSRLLRLRTGPEGDVPQPSLLVECDLCESWELIDAHTYLFQLRKGVLWQNLDPVNGRELVAEDVVYSYERQRAPGPNRPNAPLLQNMETVEAVGPYTLRITTNPQFADADFLVSLADGHTKVVAREAVEVSGDLLDGPVIGTGPWILKSTQEKIGSFFERNPDYFEERLPFLDELVITVIRDEETRLAAFLTERVDVYRISPESWQKLVGWGEEPPSFLSRQAGTGLLLAINVSAPPFDKHKVRKAVLRALDPWGDALSIWADQGFVSVGVPVESPDWLLSRSEMRGSYFADPSDASRILSEADVLVPVEFNFKVADFGELYLQQAQRIAEALESVGFSPVMEQVHPTQYVDEVWRDRDYQLSLGNMIPTSTTNSFLFAVLHSQGTWNIKDNHDEKLNGMIAEQAVETDPVRRREIVKEIQRHILEVAYMFSPATGTIGTGARWALSPNVRGFYPNTAASEYIYWARTWVE